MLRKSGLSQLMKFNKFIKHKGGDISSKLKDKSVKNALDSHIETSDDQKNTNTKTDKQLKNLSKKSIINKVNEDRYLTDDEIESKYDNFKITEFSVTNFNDEGGASGGIEIEFEDPDEEDPDYRYNTKYDNWIKYDSGPRIAFDYWYPSEMSQKLKEYIEKGIKEERIKREANKYNL